MIADPDTKLMLRLKDGDEGAFRDLFVKYKRRIINFCFRFSGSTEVAEELAQEVFFRVYKAAPGYRPKARFSTWLFRIATNVCLNEVRKIEYRMRIDPLEPIMDQNEDDRSIQVAGETAHTPGNLVEAREKERIIREALVTLSAKERAALLLRMEDEFAYKEIARQMKCSESNVKVLIHRGRQKLKHALEGYLE